MEWEKKEEKKKNTVHKAGDKRAIDIDTDDDFQPAKKRKKGDHQDSNKIQALVDWMKAAGADTSKLSIKYYKHNKRGVIANQDIKAGEDILFVPKSLIITYNDIAKTKIGD